MEDFNLALFLWLNAPERPNALPLAVVPFFAEYAIRAIPALIRIAGLCGGEHPRKGLLGASAAALAGLPINQIELGWVCK